jgi:thiamine biosynthesis lipoprotein
MNHYQHHCLAMGTRFEFLLTGQGQGYDREHLEAVTGALLEEIRRLDGVLSRFDPRSEIARINREAAERPVRVDRELFGLLEKCEEARRLTAGYFDVTASHKGAAPALQLDPESCTVRISGPDVLIDLGGVGKGYALDRAREIMLRFGVTCGLLHGGTSSVLAIGTPHGADGWPVAVRHPLMLMGEPVAQLKLADRGLSCSAVRHPDQQQSDVVNPLTGDPLNGDAVCVVLAANATDAEILSTALLAMGREQAIAYWAAKPDAGVPDAGVEAGWYESGCGFEWIHRKMHSDTDRLTAH